jgi:hypothetical protein
MVLDDTSRDSARFSVNLLPIDWSYKPDRHPNVA